MRALVAALVLLAAAPACGQVRVVAVNGPLAAMASALAGDAAEVIYPVPEGTDPALWRPTIAHIAEIQGADLILLNGAGFAAWVDRVSLPRARTVVTTDGLRDQLIEQAGTITHSHGAEGEHSHTGTVPETWLDPAMAAAQAEAVAAALTRVLPDRADAIQAARAGLAQEFETISADLRAAGAAWSGVAIADAPGLEYFGRAAGLRVTALAWAPGAEPDAAGLDALDQAVAQTGATLVLLHAPGDAAAAQAARDRGLSVAVIDRAAAAPDGLIPALRANAAALAAAE